MSDTEEEVIRFVPYVPEGFEGQPVDVVDALKRGKAVLVEEEDRWTKEMWFTNPHPEVDIQDPFCNSWKVCAEGAVLICTIGIQNESLVEGYYGESGVLPWNATDSPNHVGVFEGRFDEQQQDLYEDAKEWLRKIGAAIYRREQGCLVPLRRHDFNDMYFTTRDQVVAWFDEAIAAAEADKGGSHE